MSNLFLYIFSSICFIVFLLVSYFSNAWAKVKKDNNEQNPELKALSQIKLILTCAKNPRKSFNIEEWLSIFLSTTAATVAIVAVQLLDMHIVFVFKILVTLIVLQSAAIVDWKTHTIPNILSIILIVSRFIFLPFECIYQKDVFNTLIISSLIGAIATFLVLYLIHKVTKGGFGMGDVKLLSSLGLMVGISSTLTTILFGMIVAATLGVLMILLKRKTRKDTIPFGPFIFVGFIISVALGVF